MKIAGIIFESLQKTGGYEIFTYNLHKALAERGHDVTLYVPRREWRKRREFYEKLAFRVRPLIHQTNFFLKKASGVLQTFVLLQQLRHKYDVWQVMGSYPEGWATHKLAGRVPRVYRSFGEDIFSSDALGYGFRRDPDKNRKIEATVKVMDRTVAMTRTIAQAQADMGVPREHILPIPNGISVERFSRKWDIFKAREKWGIPAHKPVILTIGRNHAKKGFDLIPGMAARLKERGLDFTWLIIGRETESLIQPVLDHGVENMVLPMKSIGRKSTTFDPSNLELPVDELLEVYAMSDFFVLPSRLEGFSRVLLEAMAAGLPVITTDGPGCGEVLEHGVQGFVSKVDDAGAMADFAGQLISDETLRDKMSASAREYARGFDWDAIAGKYEAAYKELVEQK